MKKALVLFPVLALILAQNSQAVTRYNSTNHSNKGVTLTLADPSGSVYKQGESVVFTVRTDTDAYVLVFDIDTEGFVNLLYPRQSNSLHELPANQPLQVPQDVAESLRVSGMTGMEFVFALAVPDRDAISQREIASLLEGEKRPFHKRYRVDGDPFLAANQIAEKLVRGVRYNEQVSVAFTYFYVDKAVDYPRYLCEECFSSGKDPYGAGAPEYVATAAFDSEDRLSYPLAPAFEFERDLVDNLARPDGYDDEDNRGSYDDGTTRVYVSSYYPNWGHYYGYGYYPSYASYGYYPYYYPYNYGHGFYWSIGFAFGHRYPYGHYYGYPSFGGFTHRGGHHHGESISSRSLRLRGKTRHKSTVHTGLNNASERTVRHKTTTVGNKVKRLGTHPKKMVNRGYRGKNRPVKKIVRRHGSRKQQPKRVYRARGHRPTRAVKGKSRGHSRRAVRHGVKRPSTKRYGKAAKRSGRTGKSRSVTKNRRSSSKGKSVRSSRSRSRSSGKGNHRSGRSSSRGKSRKR